MKKIIVLFILMSLVFITGCKDKKEDNTCHVILMNGDDVYEETDYEKGGKISLTNIEKEGMIFEGWYLGETKIDDNYIVNSDLIINAKFREPNVYTVKFVNFNKVLFKTVQVKEGEKLVYPDTHPSHYSTDESVFVFDGWDIEIEYVEYDLTITATYREETRYYTITFLNADGSLIDEQSLPFGADVTEPDTPTMKENDYYTYEFKSWDNKISRVIDDTTYTALYKMNYKWQNIELEGKTISFLGDSVTTFYSQYSDINSYYSVKDTYYYPTYSASIKTVQATWWYQTFKGLGMKLGVNNSWSGSCASGPASSVATSDSRINTLDNNGVPDIVVIYLGVNDNVNAYSVEQYIASMNIIIDKIRKISNAQIYIMGLQYSAYWQVSGVLYTEERRVIYNNALKELCSDRQCAYIPLDEYVTSSNYSQYMGDYLHFNADGAQVVAQVTMDTIKKCNGIE